MKSQSVIQPKDRPPGDSLDGIVRPLLDRPADHTFRMKKPCPYCGGKITFRATGWVQEDDGTWAADMGDMECSNEPGIDSDEWDEWNAEHGAHDYNDAWRRHYEGIIAALHRRVRFPLADNRSNAERSHT